MTETAACAGTGFRGPLPGAALRFEAPCGTFASNGLAPLVSSRRKRVYRGDLIDRAGVVRPVVAAVFLGGDPALYGAEVAALSRNRLLVVGPEVYGLVGSVELEGALRPVVIEEDAGESLERAVLDGAAVPGSGCAGAPLSPPGTPERAAETDKIMYDVLDQVGRLHAAGLYHRDIRLANVCVRRFGALPRDVHASLVDLELVTSYEGTDVPASAERYRAALFDRLPRAVNPAYEPQPPSSLLRDLGYLAALRFELASGRPIEEARPADLAFGRDPFFAYAADGRPVVRRLEAADAEGLAAGLGLPRIGPDLLYDPRALAWARERVAPGGFLDARARAMLDAADLPLRHVSSEKIAREVVYRGWWEQCRAAGREPEYPSFDAQPADLRASNVSQARDIPAKLRAIGYRMLPVGAVPPAARVTAFADEEVERLAVLEHRRWCAERERAGWTAGPVRDDARRTHPDLVPYGELGEGSRAYDRAAVRAIPAVLARAGYAICR